MILYIVVLCIIIYFIPSIYNFFTTESTRTKNFNFHKKFNAKNTEFLKDLVVLETKIPEIIDNRKLFKKYYKGIDSVYDLNGNNIVGVEPNAQKALYHLNLLIKGPEGKSDDVLQLAEIYHQGMHKLKPDLDVALKIYTDILNNSGEELIRDKAYDGIKDINRNRALKWLNLPPNHVPNNDPTNVIRNVDEAELINEPEIIELINDDQFNINLAIQLNNDIVNNDVEEDVMRGAKNYNDTQNTHDSQVLSTIRHSLKELKNSTPLHISEAESAYQVKKYLDSKPNNSKRQDAIKSLDKISSSYNILSNSGMTEIEGLQLVWNRIHQPMHKDNLDNLKDSLFNELTEMQVHGMNVCATGRFDRIIDTLNVVDPVVNIRPTHAINEEMMSKSAFIRSQLLDGNKDRDKLEMGTSVNQAEFDQNLKTEIINTLTRDYVDTEILTAKQFKNELNKWIDHI
jgi:hypothetical protein